MKFIHLTDTHVTGAGARLYGGDPRATLDRAVASINADHGDAEFVVITGDLTHWGDAAAYAAFAGAIGELAMPVHLMLGNHDATDAFHARFPQAPRDADGFVQTAFETAQGRFILTDTHAPGTHAGRYCARRQAWLADQLGQSAGPVFLFMHHPPFPVGIRAMDAIMMQDSDAFHAVIAPHKSRIRHLFFGHVHRMLWGNWRGVSYSCMRGLNHQVALDLERDAGSILGDFAPPAYGVVLVDDDCVVAHMHDFTDTSRRFPLEAPAGVDQKAYALGSE